MGQTLTEVHWTANDDSEVGGYIDMWDRPETNFLNPVKKRIEHSIVGMKGFEFITQGISDNGQPVVEISIRPIRRTPGPKVSAHMYERATF